MCNGIPLFAIVDPGEHGKSESISVLQTSYRYGIQALHYQLLTPSVRMRFFKINIRSARGQGKINWLLLRSCSM